MSDFGRRGFLKSLLVAPAALTPLANKTPPVTYLHHGADPRVMMSGYTDLAANLKIDEKMGTVLPSNHFVGYHTSTGIK